MVSPEDDMELRRVRITNCSRVRRSIEITSYAEVVLAKPAADAAAKKEFEELNLAEIEIDGKSYYIQQDCLEVYEIESLWKIGDRLGVYDIETESIDTTQ